MTHNRVRLYLSSLYYVWGHSCTTFTRILLAHRIITMLITRLLLLSFTDKMGRQLSRAARDQFRWQDETLWRPIVAIKARKEQLRSLSSHLGWIMSHNGNRYLEHLSQFKVVEADKGDLLFVGTQRSQDRDTDAVAGCEERGGRIW